MMNKIKLLAIAVALVVVAGACSSSTQDVPAVAASSAQQAEADVAAQQAEDEQSPFCQAIDDISSYPFATIDVFEETNYDVLNEEPEAVALVSDSYRAVAGVVPMDAPNIVYNYFAATPDLVDAAAALGPSESMSPDLLPTLVVALSIRSADIEQFLRDACPQSTLADSPFAPLFVLSPDSLVTPSTEDFCVVLADFEESFGAVWAAGGDDDQEIPAVEAAAAPALQMTSLLDLDADRVTTAYLRAIAKLLTSAFTDPEGAGTAMTILAQLDGATASADLQAMCPEINDPEVWLVDPLSSGPTTTSTVTDTVTSTAAGAESSSLYSSFSSAGGSLTVQAVEVTVASSIGFRRIHLDGTARDTDDIALTVQLSFDRGHDFVPSDFVVTAPDGTEFPADPDQIIPLDGGEISFPVDRDLDSVAGWTLRISDTRIDL